MMGVTHRIGAVTACAAILTLLPEEYIATGPVIAFVAASTVGGLLPDADTPHSTYGKRYRIIFWPYYMLQRLASALNSRSRASGLSKALGHRGMFHSPVIWTVITLILAVALRPFWQNHLVVSALCGFYIGIISHLFLDLISGGIPLFAPFTMKRIIPPVRIKTGGVTEVIIRTLLIGALIVCIYKLTDPGMAYDRIMEHWRNIT